MPMTAEVGGVRHPPFPLGILARASDAESRHVSRASRTSLVRRTTTRCRICGRPGCDKEVPNLHQARLVAPCCCQGEDAHVHVHCLQKQRLEAGALSAFTDEFWNCQACGAAYRMKYQRHLLRVLTWPSVFLPLFVLGQVGLLYFASLMFQWALPCVMRAVRMWHPAASDSARFIVLLPFIGVDVGFWLGGLLVLVFVRKVGNSDGFGDLLSVLSYLSFLPMFIHSMREPDAGLEGKVSVDLDAKDGEGESLGFLHSALKWYMLIPYTSFTFGFFLRSSFKALQKVLVFSLAGEQVLDFIEPGCPTQLAAGTADSPPEAVADGSATAGATAAVGVPIEESVPSARAVAEAVEAATSVELAPSGGVAEVSVLVAEGTDLGATLAELPAEACLMEDVQEDDAGQCVCCLEQDAIFAVRGCMHVVACAPCRRRLVYRQLRLAQGTRLSPVPPMRSLSTSHLERTIISCPLCRHEGNMLDTRKSRFFSS